MAKIVKYPFVQAKWQSGRTGHLPTILVLHYTAGRQDAKALANYFATGSKKASAHFGVGRRGEIIQMVDTSMSAWHAGKSKFKDHIFSVGSESIGVEICNTGWAYLKDDQLVYNGKHRNPASKENRWEPYTWAQQKSIEQLIKELKVVHPELKYVTGHEDVRNADVVDIKGSKTDPGPAFPWPTTDFSGLEQWHWSFKLKQWYHVPQGEGPTH